MRQFLRYTLYVLVVAFICWLLWPRYITATCIDKVVIGDRGGHPQYYIMYRDSTGCVYQKDESFQTYYRRDIGKKYRIEQ